MKKKKTIKLDKIYHESCLDTMARMPDNFVDLTVTSPPYDKLRSYEGELQWHEVIWKKIIKELYRVTANTGVVVWVVGDSTVDGCESMTSFKQAMYFVEMGFNLNDTMIYNKVGMPNTGRRYSQDFEYMFVFVKGKIKVFNPIQEKCTYAGVPTSPTSRNSKGELIGKGTRIIKPTKKLSNVWKMQAGMNKSTKDKIAHDHPAIFPELLAERHIKTWCHEYDTVYDPFTGSGTVPKMAKLLNRHYIGSECVKKYVKLSKKRLKNHT